jgi:hypothetical protein
VKRCNYPRFTATVTFVAPHFPEISQWVFSAITSQQITKRMQIKGVPIRRRHGVDLELTKHGAHHQNDRASRLHILAL